MTRTGLLENHWKDKGEDLRATFEIVFKLELNR